MSDTLSIKHLGINAVSRVSRYHGIIGIMNGFQNLERFFHLYMTLLIYYLLIYKIKIIIIYIIKIIGIFFADVGRDTDDTVIP